MTKPNKLFAGYIPIVDNGYLRAIDRHAANGRTIGIYDTDISREFAPYTRKELRALEPERVQRLLSNLGAKATVFSLPEMQDALANEQQDIVLINDDITRGLLDVSQPQAQIVLENIFLRWDRQNTTTNQEVSAVKMVTSAELDKIFKVLYRNAAQSSDWWRHVAAAVFDSSGMLQSLQHNRSMPTEYTVNHQSDPRILANRGNDIDMSLFLHAEAGCIAEAARDGKKVEGSNLYVTTFPCPNCAKIVAASGIKQVYFVEGYAMLDGQQVLDAYDVEIIKVETTEKPPVDPSRSIPYPEK